MRQTNDSHLTAPPGRDVQRGSGGFLMDQDDPFVGDMLIGKPVADRNIQELKVLRVVQASSQVDVHLDVESLAERCQMSTAAVREVLSSDKFTDLLRRESTRMASSIISKGLTRMENLICEGKPTDSISAFKAVTSAYAALTSAAPKHEAAQSEVTVEAMLAKLETLQKLKRPEVRIITDPKPTTP